MTVVAASYKDMSNIGGEFAEESEFQKLLNFYGDDVFSNSQWPRSSEPDQPSQSSSEGPSHRSLSLLPSSILYGPAGLGSSSCRSAERASPTASTPGGESIDPKLEKDGSSDEPAGSSSRSESKGGKAMAVDRRRRDSHNEFERRRRDQINNKLGELKLLVPSLNNLVSNKATVLSKAIEYISQLSTENTRANYHIHQLSTENSKAIDVINQLNDENSELRAQIEALRLGLTQKDTAAQLQAKDASNKRARTGTDAAEVPAQMCLPDEVLKQFVASSLALTTRSLVVADATQPGHPLIYVSLGFQLMTGYSQYEVLGRNCNLLQGRNTSPLTRNVIRNALRDKQEVLVEILNYKKDGTPFWNLLFITPITDAYGNATYLLGLQFDITETKCVPKDKQGAEYHHNPRAETAPNDPSVLYVPNETLKHLIASALRLIMRNIVVTDPKQSGNPIIYASPGVCQMTQYSKDEILGRNGGFLQGPLSDNVTRAQVGKALRESRECLAELLNYRKDGSPFWNLMFITPIVDKSGKPTLFIGIEYDITMR